MPPSSPEPKRPARHLGFTLVEIVIGLTIMSLMVLVSVSLYQSSSDKVAEDAARNHLQTVGNGIARWQLENNRTYPYADLDPILSRYVDNLGDDPWGNPLRVIPDQGIAYSFGSNGRDDFTTGDDVVFRYGVIMMAVPEAPARLTCKTLGTTVNLGWSLPTKNVDGTPAATGVGTWATELWRSQVTMSTASSSIKLADLPFPGCSYTDTGLIAKTTYYYQVRVVRSLPGKTPSTSSFSNRCGSFVVGESLPVVRRFDASTRIVPLAGKLTFDVDVVDPTASLSEVKILSELFQGGEYDLLKGQSQTAFHVLRSVSINNPPTGPCQISKAILRVTGGAPPVTITSSCPKPPTDYFDFICSRPVITSFRPGVVSAIVSAGTTKTVAFTIEARDDDRNLKSITVKTPVEPVDPNNPSVKLPKVWTFPSSGAYPSGVQFVVEKFSLTYDLSTTQTFFVTATAEDYCPETSLGAQVQVAISRDVTPPETPVVNIDNSNPCITSDASVYSWSIRETTRVTIHCESYDAETPPVGYRVVISTAPPPVPPLNSTTQLIKFLDGAITQDRTGVPGWTTEVTTSNFTLDYNASPKGDLKEPMKEGVLYYLGVRAQNRAGLVNLTVATPYNRKVNYPQTPFIIDYTPPKIKQVGLENPGRGFIPPPPACGSTLVGRWQAEDKIASDPLVDGSGPCLYRYQIYERLRSEITTNQTTWWGRVIYDQTNQSTELRFPLPQEAGILPNRYHLARYILAVRVRDNACNWSLTTATANVTEDQTPPLLVGNSPKILAPGGSLNDPNTLDGTWAGVFADYEQAHVGETEPGIRYFEWGVTIRGGDLNLPFPELFPGDGSWRNAGQSTIDRAIRQNMLANGDRVYLAVRAYNWSGCPSSVVTFSPSVLVDTSLTLSIRTTPSAGFVCPDQVPVKFVSTVTGGGPYFDFEYLYPRSNPVDPENQSSLTKSDVRTWVIPVPIYYTIKDLGDQTAVVKARSYNTLGQTYPTLQRQAFARIICRCQPYLLILNEGDPAGIGSSLQIVDIVQTNMAVPTSGKVIEKAFPDQGGAKKETPTHLAIDPRNYSAEALKVGAQYALVTANRINPPIASVYRLDLATNTVNGPFSTADRIYELANYRFDWVDVSRDGTFAVLTANAVDATGAPTKTARKYIKLNLDGSGSSQGAIDLEVGSAGGVLRGCRLVSRSNYLVGANSDSGFAEKVDMLAGTVDRNYQPVNDTMWPRLVDISTDDRLAAFSSDFDQAASNVAFQDLKKSGALPVFVEAAAKTYAVRANPANASQFVFTVLDGIQLYATSDNTTFSRVDSSPLLRGSPAGLRGVDIAFDGSYAVAAASALDQVMFLQMNTPDGTNPFNGPAAPYKPFGQYIFHLDAGQAPIEVVLADRLQFGQPIVRIVEPTPVVRGTQITIRGSNVTPLSSLLLKIGGIAVPAGNLAAGDNFSYFKATVPMSVPLGDQDLVVANSSITTGSSLRESVPVKVTVQ